MDLVSAMALVAQRKAVVPPVWESAIAQGAPADGRVQINSAGIIESALCPVGISPAVGDVVAIVRAAAPLIVGVLVQANPDSGGGDNPPPPPSIETGTTRFPALYTKSWEYDTAGSGGVVSDGITISPVGLPRWEPFWFYQSTIPAALAGVTVDSARFRMPRNFARPALASISLRFCDVNPTWPPPTDSSGYRIAPDSSVAAPPDVSFTLSGTAATWYPLSTSAGQALVDRPLAINITGSTEMWITADGLAQDPQSGLLEITWHR